MFTDRLADPTLREKALAALQTFLVGLDEEKVPYTGHTFALLLGELEVFLTIARRRIAPNNAQASAANPPPSTPIFAAPAEPPSAPAPNLLPPLNAIEQAVLAAACTEQSTPIPKLTERAGYCIGRVREAVARLSSYSPPFVVRTGRGIRRTEQGEMLSRILEERDRAG